MTNARSTAFTLGGLLPLLLSACLHAAPPPVAPPPEMMALCPMTVPGTQVFAADTPNGSALTFTTSAGVEPRAELRVRVHAMANFHNQRHGGMGGGQPMGGRMTPPPSRAWVDEVEDGARISMTPNDPADTLKLQSSVRMHAEHLQRHGCAEQHE